MKIYVHDEKAKNCFHWGYVSIIVLLTFIAIFNTYIAWYNSRPICNNLRAVQIDKYNRTLECVYDLGDKQEDSVDVIIQKLDN